MGFLDMFTGKKQSAQVPSGNANPSPFSQNVPPMPAGGLPNDGMPSGMQSQRDTFSSPMGNDPLGKPVGAAGDPFGSAGANDRSQNPASFSTGMQAPSLSGQHMPGVGMPRYDDDGIGEPGSNFAANSFQQETPFPGSMPPDPTMVHTDVMDAKNVELILAKLDAIRVAIQNLDHRLSRIEEQNTNKQQNGGF
jgi:hypothetical protein